MPDAPDEPLVAHSLAEAYLYLMATPCARCGRGPLKGTDAESAGTHSSPTAQHSACGKGAIATLTATCTACQAAATLRFQLPGEVTTVVQGEAAVVNPTDEPSRIVDVGQWIMLFRIITESASKETDKVEARHLGLESAQCLEEALKFYDEPDNDLPPEESLFTDASRERFRQAPEQFSKRRLIGLRAKLPRTDVMRSSLSVGRKRPWWRRWRSD